MFLFIGFWLIYVEINDHEILAQPIKKLAAIKNRLKIIYSIKSHQYI
jgi:hypothetical protein